MNTIGTLVVVSGPAGVGKTTVVNALIKTTGLARSVSATTRPRRMGEVNHRDYIFYTPEQFEAEVAAGKFLEHATIYGHRYGTPAGPVDRLLSEGKTVILAIDVQGHAAVKDSGRPCLGIFLMPPSPDDLERRMAARGDNPDETRRRLSKASGEMARKGEYEVVVTNRTVEQAARDIEDELRKRKLL
ncbi:MAG TPA: guanylate kinase [Planctomycetota bacterium]|nr:guanylate kinase [Planctomycetota bacterium]